jgi:hypothetical protein
MSVTYKDIDLLSQKSSVAGTEKLPVSDTQYITPSQIAGLVTIDSALSSSSTNAVQNKKVKEEFDKVVYLGTPTGNSASSVDPLVGVSMNGSTVTVTDGVAILGTVITAHQDISGKESTSNKVQSVSSSSTHDQYPTAKCLYDLVGDIETLLAAI